MWLMKSDIRKEPVEKCALQHQDKLAALSLFSTNIWARCVEKVLMREPFDQSVALA